jgi:predicted peptidase
MYTEALKYLIDEFIARFPAVIDPARIYIGGDSNGGFMTMRMLMSYPDAFTAAFPICEAMLDKRVEETDIQHLKEIPIWFIHAKNDPVVKPEAYAVPTYKRLIAAGAKNCHMTYWDKIVDLHAGFKNEKGEPYEYLGHFAWIPVFNDDCRLDFDGKPVTIGGREVTLMDWLAAQTK